MSGGISVDGVSSSGSQETRFGDDLNASDDCVCVFTVSPVSQECSCGLFIHRVSMDEQIEAAVSGGDTL